MRDAFGGVFTTNLLLVFIFIYVAFTAVSLNYARAFKVKNKVIDYIEQNEIIDMTTLNNACQTNGNLTKILNEMKYNKTCNSGNGTINKSGQTTSFCCNGVVVTKNEKNSTNTTYYYTINTYADWNLGALNKLLALAGRNQNSDEPVSGTWKINGEAKVKVRK